MKFELGLFENPYADPKSAAISNGHAAHRALAKRAALESFVLLKNDHQVLPIPKSVKSVAIIGPDADEARLGGYSGPGNQPVSILEGFRRRAGSDVQVRYAKGCSREEIQVVTIPVEVLSCKIDGVKHQGLHGAYFNNITFDGTPAFSRCDKGIQFQWTLFSPDPARLTYDFWSVRWTGTIKAPVTGTVQIGIDGNDGYRIWLDGKLISDQWVKRTRGTTLVDVDLVKGREYDLKIEFYEPTGNAWFRLVWDVGVDDSGDKEMEQAVQIASGSDMAVVVVGIEEGEFRDRAILSLPGRQEELIRKVAATGKPVVVMVVGGSAVVMQNWMNDVAGILMVWYPGEAGGEAAAEVLFGDENPAGRLPITFPVAEGQLPLVYNHKPTGRGDDYMNLTGQPEFPFGFGLSYTRFEYGDARLQDTAIGAADTTLLSVKITNAGSMAGDEVVQLYIRDELASVARPVMELKGFQRIRINPGESKVVQFSITPELLSMLDKDLLRVVEPGCFRIMIGASSKDIRQRIVLEVRD
jgi:beta-glucosidase